MSLLWLGEPAWLYAAPEVKPMPAVLLQPRAGLGHVLAKLLAGEPVKAARELPVSPVMLSAEWKQVDPEAIPFKFFRERLGTIWEAARPGSKLSFKFRGSLVRLFDIVGPDGGQVIVTVDGRSLPKPIPRFDSFCTYHRLATLPIAEGLDPGVVHSVVLEVHAEQPDRSSVAPRLKNAEEELKSSTYKGTKLWAGQILMLGELVEP